MLRLRFSPVTEGRLTVDHISYEADDAEHTNRTTRNYSFAMSHDLSKALSLEASLGFTRVETDETIAMMRTTSVEDGATGMIGLTWELPNGTLGASFERIINHNGARDELTLSRELDLPAGALLASIGATNGPSGKTHLIGELSWQHALRTGILSAKLARSVATSSDDEDELLTRFSLAYNHEINAFSGLSLSASYIVNEDFLTGSKTENASLGLSYRRDLDRDWSLTAGYTWRQRDETGSSGATSHAVFIALGRSFSFRP